MKCVELLEEARDILGDYCFSEDGEYNNDEVLDMCEKIDNYFKKEGEKL